MRSSVARLLRTYLKDQSLQSLEFYQSLTISFQALNLYGISHSHEYTQLQQLVPSNICTLTFHSVYCVRRYNQIILHLDNTPSLEISFHQFL